MIKIGICNQKGGVGKTTICLCLSGAFAEMGKRVLLIDMDQQGSLSFSFLSNIQDIPLGIADVLFDEAPIKAAIQKTAFDKIDILPANPSLTRIENELQSDRDAHYHLADKLKDIGNRYDIILMDSPPNLGITTWSVLTASDGVIIPLEAQDYSVKGTGTMHRVIQQVRKRANPRLKILGYIINRYDGRRRIEQDFKVMIENHLEGKVFKQVLKDSVRYVESVTLGKPINPTLSKERPGKSPQIDRQGGTQCSKIINRLPKKASAFLIPPR